MEKAKRFQPLAVLNQKLKGLDVFESNENIQPSLAGPLPDPSLPLLLLLHKYLFRLLIMVRDRWIRMM